MPSKEIVARYSCKRKRDVITGTAVTMLVLVVLAQLYLTMVVPIQLQKRNIYEFHVEKDKVIKQADNFRGRMRNFRPSDKIARGEVDLVRGAMDQLIIYLTEHQDEMNDKQVFEIKRIFSHFDGYMARWKERKPRFHIRQEKVDQRKLVNAVVYDLVAERKK